jgi:VanZ family protein
LKVMGAHIELGKRVAAWCCILAIGILSLLPAVEVAPMRTSLGGHVEHLLTYAAAGFITAAAYLDQSRLKIAAWLVLYAAVLEFLQRYAPGRLSRLEDLAFSTAGIVLGVTVLHLLQHARARQEISNRSRYANEDLNSRS